MERLITNSHLFSWKERNYARFSFLLQLRVSTELQNQTGERKSRESTNNFFVSGMRRWLPKNICDWSLLVLFLIREPVFCRFSPLLFILKLSILPKHQHSLPFLCRAQCLLKPGHEQNKYIKRDKKIV